MLMPFLLRLLLIIYHLSLIIPLAGGEKIKIKVGHFPNITHAQALIGHQLSREGKGWFEERLGPDVEVQWFVYNAGPSAMEAILTEAIDLAYVGPSPSVNAYIKSKGEDIRIVCGSCSGGAALIIQPDGRIKDDADFRGKKIGTPQFGNTQDVAARSWLKSIGLTITQTGGDAMVIPTENPDQLLLFKSRDLDAVWTIEPWVSNIVLEGNGKVYFEESVLWKETGGKYITTHIVSGKNFLKKHPELIKKWVLAQVELTEWIKGNSKEAKELVRRELKMETHVSMPERILDRSWDHIELTYDPIRFSLLRYAEEAYRIGFLKQKPDLKNIYDLRFLNEVLKEKGKELLYTPGYGAAQNFKFFPRAV